jgi:hypothetical protein
MIKILLAVKDLDLPFLASLFVYCLMKKSQKFHLNFLHPRKFLEINFQAFIPLFLDF